MRMVATDLDGTIVRPDGTISARTVAAFDACVRVGVDVVFVTGRPPRWLDAVVEQTGRRGLALCANGALVYDLASEQVVRSHTIARADVLEVRRRLLDAESRFLFLTVYAVRMSALAIGELLAQAFADLPGRVEAGELAVREEARGLLLPTAIFARWTAD